MKHTLLSRHRRAATFLATSLLAACQLQGNDFFRGQGAVNNCLETRCEILRLDGHALRDYGQLNELGHVTSLMMNRTDFADLEAISGMAQLRELHVGDTPIQDFSGLSAFTNLELFHARGFDQATLEGMSIPQSVRESAIGHESLVDLAIVRRTPALRRLHLSRFSGDLDLSSLRGHQGLQSIHIDTGSLTQRETIELAPLLSLPNLQEVSFTFDPRDPAGLSVVAELRARGVEVNLITPVIILC